MNDSNYNQIKKDLQRMQNLARHLIRELEALNEKIEKINPSNPTRRKTPTLDELTQMKLLKLFNRS